MKKEIIPIAGDHKSFELKSVLIGYLKELGFEPLDLGTYSTDRVDYPVYSLSVADKVSRGIYKRGIVMCKTGIGVSIVANKLNGVRCGVVRDVEVAELTRKHNDLNVLAIGSGYTSAEEAKKIVEKWLFTMPEGGRHQARIDQISSIEKNTKIPLYAKERVMIISSCSKEKELNLNDVKISASLMCANQLNILKDVEDLIEAGIDSFHVDIIDGLFVNNLSMNPGHISELRRHTDLPINVHLMVKEPEAYIDRLKDAGADSVIVHMESEGNIAKVLEDIKSKGMRAGIGVKVDTPLDEVYPLLDKIDHIMFMCTPIGFKGQDLVPDVIKKIESFNNYKKEHKLNIQIIADGCIGPRVIPHLYKAGVRIFLGGTAGLFKGGTFKENIRQMKSFCC